SGGTDVAAEEIELRWRLLAPSLFQDKTEDLGYLAAVRHEASDLPVEGRQPAAPTLCQGEEMSVRNLTVADEADFIQKFRGSCRDVVVPENMMRKSHDPAQEVDRFLRALRIRDDGRIGGDADKTALCDRACGPTCRLAPAKPGESGLMMDMGRPCESYEQVDVEQAGH